MPIKVKQEDGTEIETLTAAEVDAKLKEKETEINGQWEGKLNEATTKLTTALEDKKKIEDQIAAGGGNQSENFKNLKIALDKKDGEIAELRTNQTKLEENRLNEGRDAIINKFVGTDKVLKDKILHHYNETLKSVPAKTQEEVSKRLEAAIKLSVENIAPSVLQNAINGGGGPGFIPNQNGPAEFTSTQKSLGAKMGITEDDYKKYGSDPRLSSNRKK